MKTKYRYKIALVIISAIIVILAFFLSLGYLRSHPHDLLMKAKTSHPTQTVDPHAGQVYINDGFGMVWMTPYKNVEVNPFFPEDFTVIDGKISYTGSDYTVLRGIDVSEWQHQIDWTLAAQGIDFAYIRLGFRGNTQGGIFEDSYFRYNIENAAAQGLQLGVYFYSQAITPEEAVEEAQYVLDVIKDYNITLPVVFDWEKVDDTAVRTFGLDRNILDSCAAAFCDTIRAGGYEPCVYFNRYMGYYYYDISKLTDYKFWISVPGSHPDFYYAGSIWQYSFTETVPGIDVETDMNLMFIPKN